ncbi:DsbA family protein [Candidatus Pacearchaeota archaeon]|nr:DsbA family protein [Candidatus Pacearchaeota archaeon]
MGEPAYVDKKEANKALIISGVVIVILIAGLFTNGFGLFDNDEPENFNLEIGEAPVLGNPNAPVVIYEFSDFSCPACALAAGANSIPNNPSWKAPLPNIKKEYVDTGKAKLVFKYFPGHGTGAEAHRVGWCLNDQGLFWKFHDEVFTQQENTGNLETMKSLALTIGANEKILDECLEQKKYDSLLQKDRVLGASNGVKGTPAFFVNNNFISGAQSFEQFKKIIDKEL